MKTSANGFLHAKEKIFGLISHRLKTLRNGIGNAISNAIESRVPSSFRMN